MLRTFRGVPLTALTNTQVVGATPRSTTYLNQTPSALAMVLDLDDEGQRLAADLAGDLPTAGGGKDQRD